MWSSLAVTDVRLYHITCYIAVCYNVIPLHTAQPVKPTSQQSQSHISVSQSHWIGFGLHSFPVRLILSCNNYSLHCIVYKKIYFKWLAFNVTGNAILVKTDTFLKTYINVDIFKAINFYNISRNSLAKKACLKCCFKTLWPISKT